MRKYHLPLEEGLSILLQPRQATSEIERDIVEEEEDIDVVRELSYMTSTLHNTFYIFDPSPLCLQNLWTACPQIYGIFDRPPSLLCGHHILGIQRTEASLTK